MKEGLQTLFVVFLALYGLQAGKRDKVLRKPFKSVLARGARLAARTGNAVISTVAGFLRNVKEPFKSGRTTGRTGIS